MHNKIPNTVAWFCAMSLCEKKRTPYNNSGLFRAIVILLAVRNRTVIIFRLFTPKEPGDILQIESNIRQFATRDVTNQVLIHTGIRHIPEGSGFRWEWGTSDPIEVPWWCDNQPDSDAGQPVVAVNAERNPLCFHDVADWFNGSFICNQGK